MYIGEPVWYTETLGEKGGDGVTGERLFQMMYLLLEHGRMKAGELAERLAAGCEKLLR